jgi:hypothetical protein
VATKAEVFRYFAERAGWKRASEPERPGNERPAPGERTPSLRAGKKAQYALESSAGRPSRKSTRRSANRQKNDVQFRMKRRVSEARAQDRPAHR